MLTEEQKKGLFKAIASEDRDSMEVVCRVYRRLLLNHIVMAFGNDDGVADLYRRCEEGLTSDIDAIDDALKIHARLARIHDYV